METRIEAAGLARVYRHRRSWLGELANDLHRNVLWVSHQKQFPRALRDQACRVALRLRRIGGGTASNAFETDVLNLIFAAVAIANLATNATASPATTITFALHTADPGEAGTQATSEATYGAYVRQTVARSAAGFTIASGSANLVANLSFPTSSGAGSTITFFSVGSGVSNYMIASGTVTPNIPIGAAGVTPILTTATAITCD